MRKIAVFIGGRANYSSIKSVMREIQKHPDLHLQVVLGSAALLDRYGLVAKHIESDGFEIAWSSHNLIEGETPSTMAKSTGLGLIEMANIFDNLKPDFVIVVGDRYEIIAPALAASYMNIPIAHTMGGEVTGTIDESIRHAVTKLAHIHFPANEDARQRIIKMGENPDYVFNFGCPRIDIIREELDRGNSREIINDLFDRYGGVGGRFDLNEPFFLVSQHPVTTEYGLNREHIVETLKALQKMKMNTIMIWPNNDAGSNEIANRIRSFRESNRADWIHLFKYVRIEDYIHLMNSTTCLIGNTSSGLRDGSFIGTPVVNIGTRQNKRMRSKNVVDADYTVASIIKGIETHLSNGKYSREYIYGDGYAGQKIVKKLAEIEVNVQKQIFY